MKKVYSFLLGTILVMISSAAFADNTIKINIDDVSRVRVKVNNVELTNLVNGLNSVTMTTAGSMEVKGTDGNAIVEVVKNVDGKEEKQNIYSLTMCYVNLNFPTDNDATIKITTNTFDNLRTAQCTIKVDDASKVRLQRSGTYTIVPLQNGDNTVKWIPDVEKELVISNANYGAAPLYSIVADGTPLPKGNPSYNVKPKDGGLIVITANYPDKDCAMNFVFNPEEGKGVVTAVSVDNKPVDNFTDPNFTVKAGSRLSITFNIADYAIEKVTVNGVPYQIYGSLELTVTEDMKIEVAAHKFGTVKAKLFIDNPEHVIVYQGYDSNSGQIALKKGENDIEVSEKDVVIRVVAKGKNKITRLAVDGKKPAAAYGVYTINVKEGMVIDIETQAPVTDRTATVYIDDIHVADRFFYLNRQDRTQVELNSGENTVKFGKEDNPFTLAFGGSDLSKLVVRLNGKELATSGTQSNSFELELNDRDRIEIFFKGLPTNGIHRAETNNGTLKDNKRVVYRIDGTRVEQKELPKGLYIINGKKILINK